MSNIVLYSERLVLKTINESAAKEVLNFVIRNKEFLMEWEAQRTMDYYTLEAQKQILIDESKKIQNGDLFKLWIYKAEDTKRIIGSIALNNIIGGVFQSCHLGYRIDKDERNKGFMTEALRQVITYAFIELRLHRIEANIMPRNKASLKVVENLGFYNEGVAIKYLKINGAWEDHLHMVIRNTELE
ncbi:ribosomal-protein-alanine N-acetyltransferase [Paenibacillus sp. 1_12]|uniref:GNAT family N-acetyltransferase n=1 Tax=Paenibacillus sp. 1_12 TaxID=1566278 RepID=UPI0008E03ADE|nr:GNAT family protein [Paenibacillus sp. 1_12]SFM47051.1 ribosomal-protein-alanine N-acetyltransferase [Paenibacillus sp. 1_12]